MDITGHEVDPEAKATFYKVALAWRFSTTRDDVAAWEVRLVWRRASCRRRVVASPICDCDSRVMRRCAAAPLLPRCGMASLPAMRKG